jgi:predicted SprT family Zn-dependent metalloprotease
MAELFRPTLRSAMKNQWISMIDKFYEEALVKIQKSTGQLLNKANIDIFVSVGRTNGYWSLERRMIGLNERLFKYHEQNAVKFVLWHEIAHQMVSEIYKYEGAESHGEHFKRACLVLGIDDKACHSVDFLVGYKCGSTNPVMKKLEKLLDVSGRSEEEAQIFLNKANELMIKHNLNLNDILGRDRLFLKRQVGENYNRFPTYLFKLGKIMEDFYGVKYIKSYATIMKDIGKGNIKTYTFHIELYGEPDKLDLAEYVYDNILRKAEELYEVYKNDENRYKSGRKLSKKAYFSGLLNGFYDKLKKSQVVVVKEMEKEKGELICLDDPVLTEYYDRAYSNKRSSYVGGGYGSGYGAGYGDGQGMSISSGVNCGNRGGLIGA